MLTTNSMQSILYGTKTHQLSTSPDPFTHELFQSKNSPSSDSSRSTTMDMPVLKANINKGIVKVQNKPHLGFVAMFQKKKLVPKGSMPKSSTSTTTSSTSKTTSATAGTDAALAQLQNSLASENAKKAENTQVGSGYRPEFLLTHLRTKYIKDGAGLPNLGKRGGPQSKSTTKSKFLSQNRLSNDTARSMPSSPAMSGVNSPSMGPTSVPLSQQQSDKEKAARKPIIHLLALAPMTEKALRDRTDMAKDDFKQALSKVADLNATTGKYELRKKYWKEELDVWTFKYEGDERQQAIDNAVKQYDKMRSGVSEPEWERLLVKAERGTGKCLSKLQVQIAQRAVQRAPKINVEKAEGSGRDTPSGREEDVPSEKNLSKVKGESMARSGSQPSTTKSKKGGEKAAQTKRVLSKNAGKAVSASKPASAKKGGQAKSSAKALSTEFVNDSDEEDDYLVEEPKPLPKQTIKRSREKDDAETSDSSIPLSKKVKKEAPSSHRISDASQSSRNTSTSNYSYNSSKKDNSPHKSSPLTTSLTNASDDHLSSLGGHTSSSTSPAQNYSTKNSRSPIHKRHQKSSSVASSTSSTGSTRYLKPEVADIARKYKMFYPKYEALHRELVEAGEEARDKKKEKDLFEMHERLAGMKKEILAGIVVVEGN